MKIKKYNANCATISMHTIQIGAVARIALSHKVIPTYPTTLARILNINKFLSCSNN